MSSSIQDLKRWFAAGVEAKASHMIVVCDTFDYEDYPVYAGLDNFWRLYDEHDGKNMQRIMEVYDLSYPWSDTSKVVWQKPPRPVHGYFMRAAETQEAGQK